MSTSDLKSFIRFSPKNTPPYSEKGLNFWIEKHPISGSNCTGSFIVGATVPVSSSNGDISQVLENATKMFFKYPYNQGDCQTGTFVEDRYYEGKVETRKKYTIIDGASSNSHYYLKFENSILVPASSSFIGDATSSYQSDVFFEPDINTKLDSSPYYIEADTFQSNRKSEYAIRVTKNESFAVDFENLEAIPARLYAQIQDSMYADTGWFRARYFGSSEPETQQADAFLEVTPIQGRVFSDSTQYETIRNLVSKSADELETTPLYFNTNSSISASSTNHIGSIVGNSLLPFEEHKSTIYKRSSRFETFIYSEEGNKFKPVVTSRIYIPTLQQVLTTDVNGLVLGANDATLLSTNTVSSIEAYPEFTRIAYTEDGYYEQQRTEYYALYATIDLETPATEHIEATLVVSGSNFTNNIFETTFSFEKGDLTKQVLVDRERPREQRDVEWDTCISSISIGSLNTGSFGC